MCKSLWLMMFVLLLLSGSVNRSGSSQCCRCVGEREKGGKSDADVDTNPVVKVRVGGRFEPLKYPGFRSS